MSRTGIFSAARRVLHLAEESRRTGDAPALIVERAEQRFDIKPSRRAFLGGLAASAALVATSSTTPAQAKKVSGDPRIAIIGGGLAGLSCADRLRAKGYTKVVIYEANSRLGGRCYSDRTTFPGQTVEKGGEFIDNLHKNALGLAQEFKLELEDVTKAPGETVFFFNGQHYSELEVVAQTSELTRRMQDILAETSAAPDAFNHTAADVLYDNTSIGAFLGSVRSELPLACAVIEQAYEAEYGLEVGEQSLFNLIYFMRMNRRRKFEPYGSSDERYHIVDGNDRLVSGLADRFTGTLNLSTPVTGIRRLASGEYAVQVGSTEDIFDAVVSAIPLTVLRTMHLDASLGIPPAQLAAIHGLGYGVNAKTMIGFDGEPWLDLHGCNGSVYANLADMQNVWRSGQTALTDYASGLRALRLQQPGLTGAQLQANVELFLNDLDQALPGTKARASRVGGLHQVSFMDWLNNPWSRGSYTCYKPGQFTSMCRLEAQAVGHLYPAGEQADDFYDGWQGYLDGAINSGYRAAEWIMKSHKLGLFN